MDNLRLIKQYLQLIFFGFHNLQDNPNPSYAVYLLDQRLSLQIIQVFCKFDFLVLFITVFDVYEDACGPYEVT